MIQRSLPARGEIGESDRVTTSLFQTDRDYERNEGREGSWRVHVCVVWKRKKGKEGGWGVL